jgi:hypothetical protein
VIGKLVVALCEMVTEPEAFSVSPPAVCKMSKRRGGPHSRIDNRLCDLVRNSNFAVSVLLHVNGNLRIINTLFWRSCASMASLASLLLTPPTRT